MYYVSAQGVDERMINVHYHYYRLHQAQVLGVHVCVCMFMHWYKLYINIYMCLL